MKDIQLEILEEIKKLAVDHATIKANLESHLKSQERHEEAIEALQNDTKKLAKHDFILKSMLGVYGVIISGFIGKYISGH